MLNLFCVPDLTGVSVLNGRRAVRLRNPAQAMRL
jgi:hypothetical protein